MDKLEENIKIIINNIQPGTIDLNNELSIMTLKKISLIKNILLVEKDTDFLDIKKLLNVGMRMSDKNRSENYRIRCLNKITKCL